MIEKDQTWPFELIFSELLFRVTSAKIIDGSWVINKFTRFREKATSALKLVSHASPLSRWNWNIIGNYLVFQEGGKPEYLEKNPRSKDKNKLNQHMAVGQNWTWVTLVISEHSHQCFHPCSPTSPTPWAGMHVRMLIYQWNKLHGKISILRDDSCKGFNHARMNYELTSKLSF